MRGKLSSSIAACLIFLVVGCKPMDPDSITPDKVFVKYFGGSGVDEAADFVINTNGLDVSEYVIFGTSSSGEIIDSVGHTEWVLIFADKFGNQNSAEIINFPNAYSSLLGRDIDAHASRIIKTSDGEYVLIGTIFFDTSYELRGENVVVAQQSDMVVMKVAADGTQQEMWRTQEESFVFSRVEGGVVVPYDMDPLVSNQTGSDIVEVADGGFIAIGSSNKLKPKGSDNPSAVTFADNNDIFVVKLTSELDTVWTTTLGLNGTDLGVSLVPINNGNTVLIAGITDKSLQEGVLPNRNIFILPISATSIVPPQATGADIIGDENFDEEVVRMRRISDTDVYLAGNSSNALGTRPFLIRYTGGGAQLNERLGEVDGVTVTDVVRTQEGRFLFAATTAPTLDAGVNGSQLLLMRTDAFGQGEANFAEQVDGRILFPGFRYGGSGDEKANAVAQLPDGSLVLLGTIGFDNNPNTLIGLIKTNRNGLLAK